jgi:hypothetical protein
VVATPSRSHAAVGRRNRRRRSHCRSQIQSCCAPVRVDALGSHAEGPSQLTKRKTAPSIWEGPLALCAVETYPPEQASPRPISRPRALVRRRVRTLGMDGTIPGRQEERKSAEFSGSIIWRADPGAAGTSRPCSSSLCLLPCETARACSRSPTVLSPSSRRPDRRSVRRAIW